MSTPMPNTRPLRFLIGALGAIILVLLIFFATDYMEATGPGCSEGIGKPTYWAHIRHEYGLGVPAITVATDGCFDERRTQVTWHTGGLLLLGVILVGGGLLGGWGCLRVP